MDKKRYSERDFEDYCCLCDGGYEDGIMRDLICDAVSATTKRYW